MRTWSQNHVRLRAEWTTSLLYDQWCHAHSSTWSHIKENCWTLSKTVASLHLQVNKMDVSQSPEMPYAIMRLHVVGNIKMHTQGTLLCRKHLITSQQKDLFLICLIFFEHSCAVQTYDLMTTHHVNSIAAVFPILYCKCILHCTCATVIQK